MILSSCSGLGYILGSSAKVAAGDWHWALRVRSPSLSSLSSSFPHGHVLEKGGGRDCPAGHVGEAWRWSGVRGFSEGGTHGPAGCLDCDIVEK